MTTDPTFNEPQQAHYQEICRMNAELGKLAATMERRKEAAKKATADYNDAVSALREAISRGPALFDKNAPEPSEWRAVPLSDAGVPAAAVTLMAGQAELATLGDLVDWQDADKKLTDIKGIGEGMAGKIEEALTAFWEAHPEFGETETKDDETEEE
jgi:hypothetical protein